MLIVGANVMEQLAHVGSRIQDAAENGCAIVVADPRVSRLAPQATLFLHPRPGADLSWVRALIKTIIDRNIFVAGAAKTPGFEELQRSLVDVTMGAAAEASGVSSDGIAQAAVMLAEHPPVVVMFGLGVLQQPDSTRLVKALADVAILLGGTVLPLRGQNNAQGSCDVGLLCDTLPGYAPLTDAAARRKWESLWRCRLPSAPGLNAVNTIRACASGELKALLVFGENVALSAPNTEESLEALDRVDFLAVADLYLTETAERADVVFPACSFLEKNGTFTNIEGRVQRVRKMFEPMTESKSDLEIIAGLSGALGTAMETDPRSVMAEIAANVQSYKGVSYEALDKDWAPPGAGDGGAGGAGAAEHPRLVPITAGGRPEDPEYPFRLIASRINYHQQTLTMSARSAVLAREYPEAFAELSESEAARLGLKQGRPVRISSRSGSLVRTLILSNAIPSRCVHVPHFFGGNSPNALSSYDSDPASGVPAYKSCAVKIEAVK
jgi:predicted molibdopterin-dependent oxidoreductase YjgC